MNKLDDKKSDLEETVEKYKQELKEKDEMVSKLQLELAESEKEKVQILQKANELK